MATSLKEEEMKKRILWAVNNRQNMTHEELKTVRDEVLESARTILGDKAGGFLWESGFEILDMLVD